MTAKPTDLLPERIYALDIFSKTYINGVRAITHGMWNDTEDNSSNVTEYVRSDVADKWKSEAFKLRQDASEARRLIGLVEETDITNTIHWLQAAKVLDQAIQSFDSSTKGDT
jgi:hypothetical protein